MDDEEWGEERMIAAAQAYRGLPAGQMIERMIAEADAFAAGAPQYDDMTLVVVKLGGDLL
jgi:sigma-B regulation protein RsbU (phosphoserine phosphatase)